MHTYKRYIPLVVIGIFGLLSFLIIRPFFLAISLGALLAYLFHPWYRVLSNKFHRKTLPALIVCLFVLAIFGVLSFFFVNTLIRESYVLFALGKQKLAVGLFTGCENSFCRLIEGFGEDPAIAFQAQEVLKAVTNWIISKGSSLLLGLPNMILGLFVTFFTMFYFLRDGKKLLGRFYEFLHAKQKRFAFIERRLKEVVRGVIFGYLVVALIQGAFGALGFFMFGVSSPVFWGVVMALLALVPFLGTGFIWVPASVILFLDGVFQDSPSLIAKGIGLFVYSFIFVSSIDNFLRPKLISQKAGIHPAIILVGILGGIVLMGPLGVVLGPLILSLTWILVNAYVLQKDAFDSLE